MPAPRQVYGLRPDPVDERDLRFRKDYLKIGRLRQKLRAMRLPESVDLREEQNPPIWDQGDLGSCTAQATAAVLGHVTSDQGDGVEVMSRLMLYGNARGWVPQDDGATLRDMMKGIDRYGVCLESMWPYDLSKWKERPPQVCWDAGYHREAIDYYRLETLDGMRICLAEGKPFVFGVLLYDSFEASAHNDYTIPMPKEGDRVSGGHAMAAMGYSNPRKAFLVRNSWGDWGDQGYCWIPYSYFEDAGLFYDAWTVRSIPA